MNKLNIFTALLVLLCFCSCITSKNTIKKEENPFPAVTIVKSTGTIDVMVDPNVELMNIIQRLAGQPPYISADKAPYLASYLNKVDEYFEPFKSSSAVTIMRYSKGMSYGRSSELGMYLNSDDSDFIMDPKNEKFVVLDGPAKEIPYYYSPNFRKAVREFRIESNFDQFFLNNIAEYEELIEKHIQILIDTNFNSWLEDFYGKKPSENPCVYVTKLTGNYGIPFVNPEGKVIPHVVLLDQQSTTGSIFLISHEFSHPMTHDMVEELYKEPIIGGIFDELYSEYKEIYNSNGYTSGNSILHETINQACANKFNELVFSENEMQWFADHLESRKYIYVPAVAEFLDHYQNNRDQYKTIEEFIPELKTFLMTLKS